MRQDLAHLLYGLAFRALAASRADRWLAGVSRGDGVILTFHHVRPWVPAPFAPNRSLEVTPDFLDHVLTTLRREGFEVIPVDALAERLAAPAGRRPFAVLTFDDGYRDNILHAQPILRRHGAHWALFVTEAFAAGTGRLWWRELEYAIARLARLPRPGGGPEIDAETPAAKGRAFARIRGELLAGNEDAHLWWTARLADWAGIDVARIAPDLCAGWAELGSLAGDPLVTLGSHTLSHPVLARRTAASCADEIGRSRTVLAARLGRPIRHLAYPHGGGSDAGAREYEVAGASGYATAMTTRPGHLSHRHAQSLTALPRISMNGLHQSDAALRSLLSGVPFLPARLAGVTGRRPRPQNRPGAFA